MQPIRLKFDINDKLVEIKGTLRGKEAKGYFRELRNNFFLIFSKGGQ